MSKKMLALLLSLTLSMTAFVGCGGAPASSAPAESASSSAAPAESTASAASSEAAPSDAAASTDFTGEDPKIETKIKILSIWAEDNDNGVLINAMAKEYQEKINPNFSWEYEFVAPADLTKRIATLAAANDLPDMFAYESGKPLKVLIDADKVLNVSETVKALGCEDSLNDAAVALMKGLTETEDIYDLPLGLNVEGFWYNKELFEKAGCTVPTTWEEFEATLEKLAAAGIQPMATAGADKWPATRLVNALAVRMNGNDILTKAANAEISYTEPGLVAAADKLAEWATKGYFGQGVTTVDSATAGSMLMTGKAAIYYNGSWFTSNLTDPAQNPAGEDGIGFFNVPVKDEALSSSKSYSMNCGNVLCLDKAKYNEGTGWFLKYFIENMGNMAMTLQGSVKGYNYTATNDQMSSYTKLVLDELTKANEGFAWWEAKMAADVSKTAQENVQSLLNGDMTGAEYMQSIQDMYDMSGK